MLYNNIDILVLMTFFMLYVFLLMFVVFFIKQRQHINSGDKQLTLKLVDEAKSYNFDLYRITNELDKRTRGQDNYLENNDYNYLSDLNISENDYLKIINLLNLYNSLCEGCSNRTLNKRIVTTLMNDNFNIAYKAFFPYFSKIRFDLRNQQLFVAFEYFNSTNAGRKL